MRQRILRLSRHPKTRITIKYGIVSAIATLIDLVVLNGGIKLFGLNPQLSKTAAFTAATISVFPLQQRWVFRLDKGEGASPAKQWTQYLLASIGGFVASQIAITVADNTWKGNLLAINAANFLGFGTVWVFKLFFFQKVVFKVHEKQGITEVDEVLVEDVAADAGSNETTALAER